MIEIIFENVDFLVCVKPVGVESQNDAARDMVKILSEQTGSDIYPVHRLDKAVGGTMVFAKNRSAAAQLSKQIQNGTFKKVYLAVIGGVPEKQEDTLKDLLFKDSHKNKSFVVRRERRGVKKASLEYKVLEVSGTASLVQVLLHTGRTHQIRVQFASRGMPLLGDGKYGSRDNHCTVALWSHSLSFVAGGKRTEFNSLPDVCAYPWSDFKSYNSD